MSRRPKSDKPELDEILRVEREILHELHEQHPTPNLATSITFRQTDSESKPSAPPSS
jgi:hypothetical protein